MDGIIIINKTKNYTSFDVVAVVRKLLNEKKVGHTGTLDPMATGVLPILIGRATKLQQFMTDKDKEYVASFKLGIASDTLDITGRIISTVKSDIKKGEIEKVLQKFKGEIMQIPPMYSAVKKDGIRLYSLARKGINIERKPRKVTISELKLIKFDENLQCGALLVKCSKGTYIRTLCSDIGDSLGCGAVLTELERTKSFNFYIENSITLDELRNLASNGLLKEHVLSCDSVFEDLVKVGITDQQSKRFKNGGSLSLERIFTEKDLNNDELVRIYNKTEFVGLGRVNSIKNEISVACLIKV